MPKANSASKVEAAHSLFRLLEGFDIDLGNEREIHLGEWRLEKLPEERIELAKALCKFAHAGQTDKAGAPYYLHPFAVADKVETEDEKIVAYLHDVVEDTDIGVDTLADLFGPKVAEAVVSVTRQEWGDRKEPYMDFVKRAKLNPIGRKVKLADLEHNMDVSRLSSLTPKDIERLEKYRVAAKLLRD